MLFDEHTPLAEQGWKDSNQELLKTLREDESAVELMRLTVLDAQLGRMTEPTSPGVLDLDKVRGHLVLQLWIFAWLHVPCVHVQVRLVPRCGVTHGTKPEGTPKVRAVDHMSWSMRDHADSSKKRTRKEMKQQSVNGHYNPAHRSRMTISICHAASYAVDGRGPLADEGGY